MARISPVNTIFYSMKEFRRLIFLIGILSTACSGDESFRADIRQNSDSATNSDEANSKTNESEPNKTSADQEYIDQEDSIDDELGAPQDQKETNEQQGSDQPNTETEDKIVPINEGEEKTEVDQDLDEMLSTNIYTEIDGGILVPERRRFELIIFKGGSTPEQTDWNNPDNILWSMKLKDAQGIPSEETDEYNNIWRGDNSLNDAKRVIHNKEIHIAVTGNGGDGVALFNYETKECVYWSKTDGTGPHDVEYLPIGSGYLVIANAVGADSNLEIYDISENNNKGAIPGSTITHRGVHSIHWDGAQQRLWAWGSGNANALRAYELVFDDNLARLRPVDETYPVNIENFNVGTGHGGTPMIGEDGSRFLIFAGKSGIIRFNTVSHEWDLIKRAPDDQGIYSNPKGLSFNPLTMDILIAKSRDRIYSFNLGDGTEQSQRRMDNSEIYKARWWLHNEFSYGK